MVDSGILAAVAILVSGGLFFLPHSTTLNLNQTSWNYTVLINQSWENLTGWPAACAAGEAVTEINATPVCTAFLQTESDPLWSANATNYYTKAEVDAVTGDNETDPRWAANSTLYYKYTDTLPFDNLTGALAACSAGEAVTQIGATTVCDAFLQSESDPLWSANATNYANRTEVEGLISGNRTEIESLIAGNATEVNTNIVNNMSTVYSKTNVYNKTESDALMSGNITAVNTNIVNNMTTVYTKTEVDAKVGTNETDPRWAANSTLYYKYSDKLPAANITTGTFGAGNYVFPNNITSGTHWLNSTLLMGVCWNGTHTVIGNLTGINCW